MDYPGNSYTMRGEMKRVASENPTVYQNSEGHFYVRLKYTVWPEIYGDEFPIHEPSLEAALMFAQNHISPTIICARVFTPSGKLVTTFDYSVHGVTRSDSQQD
jgi:hypothetical protein